MPIYLPPVSRRQFLARSLAAGAGLVFGPELFASTRRTDPASWALLSDVHIAADRAQVARGVNMADHLAIVTQELAALPRRPAAAIVCGDCAFNRGETGDYATLGNLLQPVREQTVPVHLALGNHDHRERFWEAFQAERLARRPVKDRQVVLLQAARVNWFILDSLETTQSTPGILGSEQLEWLAKTLDANARKPAIVLIHHNPGINGGNMGLKDTAALFEVIRPRRQVKAYIYGHTHNWKVEQDPSGVHLINLPPVAYVFQDGNPSGWVHATIEKSRMQLELRCVDAKHPKHGQKLELEWRT